MSSCILPGLTFPNCTVLENNKFPYLLTRRKLKQTYNTRYARKKHENRRRKTAIHNVRGFTKPISSFAYRSVLLIVITVFYTSQVALFFDVSVKSMRAHCRILGIKKYVYSLLFVFVITIPCVNRWPYRYNAQQRCQCWHTIAPREKLTKLTQHYNHFKIEKCTWLQHKKTRKNIAHTRINYSMVSPNTSSELISIKLHKPKTTPLLPSFRDFLSMSLAE
jgi:hypothetical protein